MSFYKSYEAALAARQASDARKRSQPRTARARGGGFKRKSPSERFSVKQGNALDSGTGQVATPKARKRGIRGRGIRIDPADRYFSWFVRYRDNWKCQRCQTQYEPVTAALHNSHHFGRARESTRFDPVNCDALCHGCHSFFTANPADHCAWKLARIGQPEYDKLTIRANTRCKKDRTLMAIVCKQMYEKEKARYESEIA